MKANTILLAAALTLSIHMLFAGNDGSAIINEVKSSAVLTLAPGTPAEATFEELTAEPLVNILALAPVNPAEADFSDLAPEMVSPEALAPATPAVADFSDAAIDMVPLLKIAPITPAIADFEN